MSLVFSFLLYCYIGGITPGPANLCSLSAAMRYGIKPALRQWRGLFVGFFIVAMLSVAVSWLLGSALNSYIGLLSWVGAAYILWMAWHLFRSSGISVQEDPAAPTFRNGLLLNLTNVKVMICCLTALTGFVLPYTQSFWILLAAGLFLPFTGPLCNLVWLFAGASMQKLFEKHRRVADTGMAIALAVCAWSMVWPHSVS